MPPAVLCRCTPDHRGEHPRGHLAGFRGVLQADGYAGFAAVYAGDVTEIACWAHVHRGFQRAIHPLRLRQERLFAGSDAGGTRAASIVVLIKRAKLNGIDPEAYLRHVFGCIAERIHQHGRP